MRTNVECDKHSYERAEFQHVPSTGCVKLTLSKQGRMKQVNARRLRPVETPPTVLENKFCGKQNFDLENKIVFEIHRFSETIVF